MTSRSSANPDDVFTVLLHAATWPSWSPIDTVEVEGGDPEGPQQVGDTRVFRTGRATSRERIVELVTDRRFGYENLSGPFRSYRGTVELAEVPQGGTDITWSAVFEPRLRLSGRFWRWYLRRFMQRMADGLAGYAEAATDHSSEAC
ncbi:SRPBCC family protein [Streptomyces sp. MMG1121]|uniref:SRPBCC family protein n=1 Tax=Streptomyces sp. MMG1121 TaxID=1415544 RepID=UPI001F332040|nr:SRPBCC family protein [Streptomyces sp. MMG1121]